jgi:hypothetical protein
MSEEEVPLSQREQLAMAVAQGNDQIAVSKFSNFEYRLAELA